MAIFDILRRKSVSIETSPTSGLPALTTRELGALMFKVGSMDPERMWGTQPNVRSAVDFIANQVSHLSLQTFERGPDDGRKRNNDLVIARALRNPNPEHTGTELVRALAADSTLNDEAWWFHRPTKDGWEIRPLAVKAITIKSGSEIDGNLVVTYQGEGGRTDIPQKNLLHFKGWTPSYGPNGKSIIDTLKEMLAEQIAAAAYRRNLWERGGQIGTTITRPATSTWSPEARARFDEGMKAYKNGGAKSGGILLLEDGMQMSQVRFSAREEMYVEAAQLSLEMTCRAFGLNPTMLGSNAGVSYANMKEFRKMLFGETLGPRLKIIEDRITTKLIPQTDPGKDAYVEFNVQAKLAGSFDEQADYISKSVGAPWKTQNEARKLENLPPVEGGDTLMTPMNMAPAAGAAAAATPPKAGPVEAKADTGATAEGNANQESTDAVTAVLEKFFKRQSKAVLAKLNAKADDTWWNADRWNKELAADLYGVAMQVTGQVSADVLAGLGEAPDAYNAEQTAAFLQAVTESRAAWINETTLAAIQDVLDNPAPDENGKPTRTPETVFEEAATTRTEKTSGTLLATLAAFATVETAKQAGGSKATKTWMVNSTDPRSSHARMRGETVPVNEKFSNRANWPGDPVLGADGVANCKCSVRITYP